MQGLVLQLSRGLLLVLLWLFIYLVLRALKTDVFGNVGMRSSSRGARRGGFLGRGGGTIRHLVVTQGALAGTRITDRKSTRLNSSHVSSSYAVFCYLRSLSSFSTRRSSDLSCWFCCGCSSIWCSARSRRTCSATWACARRPAAPDGAVSSVAAGARSATSSSPRAPSRAPGS